MRTSKSFQSVCACRIFPVLVFLVSSLLHLPNAWATTPASISLDRGTILSGDTVTVSGAALPANSSILLWLDTNGNAKLDPEEPIFSYPVRTDATGAIASQQWTMTDVPAGAFFVQAGVCTDAPAAGLCYGTPGIAQIALTVTMGVSASKFGSGNTVAITGYGFSPSASVTVWYDTDPNGVFSSAIASATRSSDANGAFSASMVVSGGPGDYYIHAEPFKAATATIPVN
ncbi:MAG TPA: hypothetical protein VNO32_40710, partial [Candidatus Acidoferrum sp.]|nr:hypothetical protein [Candidatus Acidoferrum sp.]